MAVTREVIMDLLPLYLSEEASADSRALVKEHLENDAELAQMATQWKDRLPEPPPLPVNPEAQVTAYQEAKRQIANRVITLAAAIAFGILLVGGTALIGAMLLISR
jgi:predicted anti-sigma-YlaC factor YlaD